VGENSPNLVTLIDGRTEVRKKDLNQKRVAEKNIFDQFRSQSYDRELQRHGQPSAF
jgi:hypothetical protein